MCNFYGVEVEKLHSILELKILLISLCGRCTQHARCKALLDEMYNMATLSLASDHMFLLTTESR